MWYPRLSASRRQSNRLRAYLYELEAINRTCLRRPHRQAMQPLASRSQPNYPHLTQRTMTSPTSKTEAADVCGSSTKIVSSIHPTPTHFDNPSPQDLGSHRICTTPETALPAPIGRRPRMTKGGQLWLRHEATEQDRKWTPHCWPCALPDHKNGAMAKASVPIPSIRGSIEAPI